MQRLITTLVIGIALVVLYPPAAFAIFVAAIAILGWATWRKARRRDPRAERDDFPPGGT
jgi:Flp pilus assembly protein TadB